MPTFETPLIIQEPKEQGGRRFINPEKVGESFFMLPATDSPLAIIAGGNGVTTFQVPEDPGHAGDFEIAGLVGRSNAPFTLQLSLVGLDANALMSGPIHHNLCVGAGGFPFVFRETLLVKAGRTVQVTINNLSATLANNVRLAVVGRKFTSEMCAEDRQAKADWLDERPTRPYWLTLDQTSAALTGGGTNQQFFMTMPSGSHFLADDLMWEPQNPAVSMQIYDGQSGRELTMGAIDGRLILGNGFTPARTLGAPILQPQRSLRFVFNELSGAANTIFISFHGRRLRLPMG